MGGEEKKSWISVWELLTKGMLVGIIKELLYVDEIV